MSAPTTWKQQVAHRLRYIADQIEGDYYVGFDGWEAIRDVAAELRDAVEAERRWRQ